MNLQIYKWKRKITYCSSLLLFVFISITFLSCEKELLKESEVFRTTVPPLASNYLSNFGLVTRSNMVDDGLVFYNEYATKVVVFDLSEYDNISTVEQLKSKINQGVSVNQLPPINFDEYGYATPNFCAGILVNEDYYLLNITEIMLTYVITDEGFTFVADINGKYKY
ncbi:MAG: hypothetical protein H6Q25_639 [Bacteroidetes bacterium]|nr:hypothetical protein [Bacteroidota bacterium]